MGLRRKLPDILLLGLALVLTGALVYPLRPAPLPDRQGRPAAPPRAPAPAPARVPGTRDLMASDPRQSIREAASLFIPVPSSNETARTPPSPPEKAPWLRYLAFVVASNGQTVYFFKNDQTGRVLMLSLNEPRGGWNLVSAQGGAYVLETNGRCFMVEEQ